MSEMIVERDIAIPMRDGAHLYANLYRPAGNARFPIIVTLGPYGKDLHFRNVNAGAYDQIDEHGPFLNWETPNPEWWVAQNYVLLRIDQRGIGRSPGHLTLFSAREAEDFYDAIEWAAVQPWCTSKVGLLGISYYAITQWQVAALQPPHLAAIIPWEGMIDLYRDAARHGGMLRKIRISRSIVHGLLRDILRSDHGYPRWVNQPEAPCEVIVRSACPLASDAIPFLCKEGQSKNKRGEKKSTLPHIFLH